MTSGKEQLCPFFFKYTTDVLTHTPQTWPKHMPSNLTSIGTTLFICVSIPFFSLSKRRSPTLRCWYQYFPIHRPAKRKKWRRLHHLTFVMFVGYRSKQRLHLKNKAFNTFLSITIRLLLYLFNVWCSVTGPFQQSHIPAKYVDRS